MPSADGNDRPASRPPTSDATIHLLEKIQEHTPDSESAWVRILTQSESMLRVLAHYRIQKHRLQEVDLDDILQEVWIEASHRITDFDYRGKGSLQRWLAAILHFKILESGSEARRQPTPSSQAAAHANNEMQALHRALLRTQSGVSRTAQHREEESAVQAALATLTDIDREAVLLRVYEGKSNEECAEQLELSPSGFSKRFNRALARLKPALTHRLK